MSASKTAVTVREAIKHPDKFALKDPKSERRMTADQADESLPCFECVGCGESGKFTELLIDLESDDETFYCPCCCGSGIEWN